MHDRPTPLIRTPARTHIARVTTGVGARAFVLPVVVLLLAGCPRPVEAPPPAHDEVHALPASGDFSWSIGDQPHPLRAGAAFFAPGGALEIVMADVEVASPCELVATTRDPNSGPERVRVRVPRGLDVDYPLHRSISPDMLQLPPLDPKQAHSGGRLVPRYSLELESVDWKPGGRIVGHIAWVGLPPSSANGVSISTFGEGRFDLPLCAPQSDIDLLALLPKPHQVPSPTGPIHGSTLTGPFHAVRAFAELRPWQGLPPHVTRIELYPDPFVTCETRATAKGTAIFVEIDSETGLGKHLGVREPIGELQCRAGSTNWDCLGDPLGIRGFVELREVDLRVGGHVRGAIAVEGAKGSGVLGALDVDVCAGM